MIEKEKLREYARKLMFEMNEDEYVTLESEFEVILKQMDLIGKIDGIKDYEPMTFPFTDYHTALREDVIGDNLPVEDVLKNVKQVNHNQVKVPKVVE